MHDTPEARPGWYPTPDGGQRYWDGQQWLNIPAPMAAQGGKRRNRTGVIVLSILLALAVIGGGAFFALDLRADRIAAEEAASAQAAEDERAAAEHASARAEEAAMKAQEEADEAERASRREAVDGIEESIETMALQHIDDDLIDAEEVLDVVCSPVAGGSMDDLNETTSVFECFVATKENDDGTYSGFAYNSTINWTTGQYTYSIGAP